MDFTVLSQLNEAYRHGVYTEETLSEEELVSIEEWVEVLIEEGYDLDQYSDEDLIKSKLRKRALRNINRGMNEELDLYDIVSEYLVSEGFCDSYEDADVIMANMSEEWRESIMEEVLDEAAVRNRGLIDGRNKLADAAIDASGRQVPTHPKGLRMIPTMQAFRMLPDGNPKTKHRNKAKKDAYYQDQRYGKGSSGIS